MNRIHYLCFALLLITIVGCTKNQPATEILVDGRLKLGVSEERFRSIIGELGFTEDASDSKDREVVFVREGEDPWTSPLIRVGLSSDGRVEKLSGRMQQIQINDSLIVAGESSKESIKSKLGKPSWESKMKSPVFEDAYGLCYESIGVYFLLTKNKVVGFSLGHTPSKPSTIYVEP